MLLHVCVQGYVVKGWFSSPYLFWPFFPLICVVFPLSLSLSLLFEKVLFCRLPLPSGCLLKGSGVGWCGEGATQQVCTVWSCWVLRIPSSSSASQPWHSSFLTEPTLEEGKEWGKKELTCFKSPSPACILTVIKKLSYWYLHFKKWAQLRMTHTLTCPQFLSWGWCS